MRHLVVVWALFVVLSENPVVTRKVPKCELAQKLADASRSLWEINQFLCIVRMESNFESGLGVWRGGGRQRSLGLFQIAGNHYCYENFKAGERNGYCHTLCSAFVDDNIKDDVDCAVIIRQKIGFQNWRSWRDKCKMAADTKDGVKECTNLTLYNFQTRNG